MIFAPLEGRREALVTERHTAIDYAHALKHVADEMFPHAEKIVLVQDNLNTHKPASLYQAFEAKEARRLTERFEWHTRQSTAAGSTWPRANSASSPRNVSTAASATSKAFVARSPPGSQTATKTKPKPIGSSQPTTPKSNSRRSTRSFPVKIVESGY
jgi:hypothetical protein